MRNILFLESVILLTIINTCKYITERNNLWNHTILFILLYNIVYSIKKYILIFLRLTIVSIGNQLIDTYELSSHNAFQILSHKPRIFIIIYV